MAAADRRLIAGTWKMNGLAGDGLALASELARRAEGRARDLACDLLVCPPATLVREVVVALGGSAIAVGGQDCHAESTGAHTGDVSAEMLADAGCASVIVGHSERRADHGEGDALVRAKAAAAHRAGLVAIVCVGESAAERQAGATLDVVARQLEGSLPAGANAGATVVAYEPVWAIGSGRTPGTDEIAEVHGHILARLGAGFDPGIRVLYGGSVNAKNAAEILAVEGVGGALVGGASLTADDFWAIAESCR